MPTLTESGIPEQLVLARKLVADLALPQEIHAAQVTTGNDAHGNQALWLVFQIGRNVQPTRQEVQKLTEFTRHVQAHLIDAGITLFPFTRLEQGE